MLNKGLIFYLRRYKEPLKLFEQRNDKIRSVLLKYQFVIHVVAELKWGETGDSETN